MKKLTVTLKKLTALLTALSIFLFAFGAEAAATVGKSYKISVKITSQGEYNITVDANCVSNPVLYKKTAFFETKQKCSVSRSGNKYIIKAGLTTGTYYVKFTLKEGYSSQKVTYSMNTDTYSSYSSTLSQSKQWKPNSNSMTTSSNSVCTQIAYLTKEQAMVYALNMDKKVYLKLLDYGVEITSVLAAAYINPTSVLGKAVSAASRSKVITAARIFAGTVLGYKFPSFSSMMIDTIRTKTKNFTTGLKVTVYLKNGCYVNAYNSWNEKANTVKGASGYRGTFSTFSKVMSWY